MEKRIEQKETKENGEKEERVLHQSRKVANMGEEYPAGTPPYDGWGMTRQGSICVI